MTIKLETRASTDGVEAFEATGKRTLVGYAAVFNSPSDIGGCWMEVISPGAFTGTIGGDIRALVNHDSGRVIGRTKSGTLRLAEDAKGLRVEIDVPSTSDGNDVYELVERGDISGMSFGFCVTKQDWDETVDPPVRTISAVELREVSAVAFPAYDDTTLGVRSLEEWRSAHKTTDVIDKDKEIPAAAPVSRAVATRARLKMGLELKTRSTR